jgi:phosphotransferase system HPr (HPr) family protein
VSLGAEGATRRRVTVVNPKGIHARPAAMLAARAKAYACDLALVMIEAPAGEGAEPGTRVDAKDVLDIMFLGAPAGSTLDVEGQGPGSEQAVTALVALISEGFEE